jgi:signal transduction histidine kinase
MQPGEVMATTGKLAHEQTLRPVWRAFRSILLVVFLIFAFAIVQMFMLWRVCNTGMQTAALLEHQGLPTLNELALLQENLATFRLNSYEYLFAREGEKAGKAREVANITARTRAELENIKRLFPEAEGRRLASNLETAFAGLESEFDKVRNLTDSDFAAAMRVMDADIPPRIAQVTAAAGELKDYGYEVSGREANATFGSFGRIQKNAVLFGIMNILVSFGAIIFVLLAARRSGAQLSDTLARLDERTVQLAGSLSLVNATLESTTDGILVTDAEGKAQNSNAQFLQMFQIPQPVNSYPDRIAMQAVILPQLLHPEATIDVVAKMANARDAESFDVLDFKDGRMVERYSKPQRIGERSVGRVWSFRDVTERRRAEAELGGKSAILQAQLDSSNDGILLVGEDGKKVLQNRRLNDMWGIPEAIATDPDDNKQIEFVLQMLKDPVQFAEKVRELYAHPAEISHDEIQFKDGRLFDRTSYPAVGKDGTRYGRIWAFRDITERKKSEAELETLHRKLVDASRQAGMAEVATGVLHNVGNVLNSVNVSCNLVTRDLTRSKSGSLAKVTAMLKEHEGDLGAFMTSDPKGKSIPGYLTQLAEVLADEKTAVLKELVGLQKNIEHIKDIVAMQQSFARVSGATELVKITELVEDALSMNATSLTRHEVQLLREYAPNLPTVTTERHKVLQILLNLIRNAKHACEDSGRTDRRVELRVTDGDGLVRISVKDNGIGIPAENLKRIFNHGFTTKKDGHGFGLHSGALAAKELGGALAVHSDGTGKGATFTLELPVNRRSS